MGKDITINFARLEEDHQSYIQNYQEKFIGELQKLVDIIKENNPESRISKDKVINPANWSLKHITPDTGRSSANISLKIFNRPTESAPNGSLFEFLKNQLKEAQKNTPPERKEEIKQLRGYVDLLNLQATSVIAEVGALDYLFKFGRHIMELREVYLQTNPNVNTDDIILFNQTIHYIEQLKEAFKQYSLDFLTNGTLEQHSTVDAGILREKVVTLYKAIKENMGELVANNCIEPKYMQKIKSEVNSALGCFEHKNNISFALPTGGETKKQKTRKIAQLGLGIGTITSTVLAVGSTAITPVFPPAALGSAIFGVGALACGVAGSGITIYNSAENYLKYKIPPNTGEKITVGLFVASFGIGVGASALSSSLPILATVVSGANKTVKTSYVSGVVGKSIYDIPDQKKLKGELKAKGEDQGASSDKVQDQSSSNSNTPNP
ncbi:hypothetical protein Lsan_2587 [Legionella santicrucis]|uniref:Uncharacterized protein n=1 Tax=Legionella santicrucis TaxID=45074 RepID=A0A0W0YJ87_9GAMM|nr:hypothetical protein [Legionella santicrucis]KTD56965.1 hypothetical protein Lsan_2587 [Legionella santicrucis]